MIAPAEIAAIKARVSIVSLVARDVKLRQAGPDCWQGLCPFHAEKTPSFTVYHDHFWCFGCGAKGDAIEYVRRTRHLDFAAAIAELGGGTARSPHLRGVSSLTNSAGSSAQSLPGHSFDAGERARSLWAEADEPAIARMYLRSRGVLDRSGSLPEAIRGHPAVWCAESQRRRTCTLAAVRSVASGEITAVQRIWSEVSVEFDGTGGDRDARAGDLAVRKKTLGPIGDGAVRLGPAGATLGLAEGIETALAVQRMYRVPVWAILGVSRLGAPANGSAERAPSVWIPPQVQRLLIFGDRGETGERAAGFSANWWKHHGINAMAVFPDPPYQDFAEQLLGG